MTIKQIAYSAQQHLQVSTGSDFKRAHVYELLASAFGFNSYAALNTHAVFLERSPDQAMLSRYTSDIRHRCVELGYPTVADQAASALPAFIVDHRVDVISLEDLVDQLKPGMVCESDDFHDLDAGEDDWHDDVDADDEARNPGDADPRGVSVSALLLESLDGAAIKESPLAHYALALIRDPGEGDDQQASRSSYWYSQAQQGRVLSDFEREWADAYALRVANAEKYERHLREAARLGNERAQLDLADRFGDPAFFERPSHAMNTDPALAAQIAQSLGRDRDARKWLATAAERGDIDAMRQLIEGYDSGDLKQCWIWLYLAQLHGTDLTQDEYIAINEDGSPYDDDVGGPAYAAGDDRLKLAPLDVARDAAARLAAESHFKRGEQTA